MTRTGDAGTTTPAAVRRNALVAAELGLLAMGVATALSMVRLFSGSGWPGDLLACVGAAWAVSVATRRRRVGAGATAAVHVGVAALVLSWLTAPSTLALGLPTPATATTLAGSVVDGFSQFDQLVAPTDATAGFVVVVGASLWVLVAFADIAALRHDAPVQGVVPYLAATLAVGLLARDDGRTASAVALTVGLVAYAATQRSLAASRRPWAQRRVGAGTAATLRGAAGTGAVALVAAVVIGPVLPGSSEPVMDLRRIGEGDGPRTVVSPFVGLRSLLGDRSDEVLFTVTSDTAAYWRLTALEEFDADRDIWVSRGRYQRVDGRLEPPEGPVASTVDQVVDVRSLSGPWLPAAFAPVRIDGAAEVGFDGGSSSIILRREQDPSALDYTVRSALPDAAALVDAAQAPAEPAEPTGAVSATAGDQLAGVVGASDDVLSRLVALQDWFRGSFDYDEAVDYSGAPDALDAFLAARRGFCQQFASAFALMARELGLPSRVAVGFTPGDPVATEDGDVEFVVRGRHAHAWPEVFLGGAGWVAFEPTPRRGNPQAQAWTGVAPAQASPPADQAVTTTSASPPTTGAPTSTTADPGSLDATADGGSQEAAEEGGSGRGALLAGGLVVVVGGALLALVRAGRRRRPDPSRSPSAAVEHAWTRAMRACRAAGADPAVGETPLEAGVRLGGRLRVPELTRLAMIETRRRYAAERPTAEEAADAARSADRVEAALRGDRPSARHAADRVQSSS